MGGQNSQVNEEIAAAWEQRERDEEQREDTCPCGHSEQEHHMGADCQASFCLCPKFGANPEEWEQYTIHHEGGDPMGLTTCE